MAIQIPENLRPILNIDEETKPELVEIAVRHKAILLCIVAPYIPQRVSPTQVISASLGISEEFGVDQIIKYIHSQTKIRKLFLAINSPGGQVNSSYKIAKALGKSFDERIVFISYQSASGGTIVSLIGHKIVMGLMSHITPIDPQYGDISINSLPRAFSKVEDYFKKKEKDEAPYPWIALAEKIDPKELSKYEGILATVGSYAYEILYNTLIDSMEEKDAKEKAKKIANILIEFYPSHSHLIGAEGAKSMGLNIEKSTEYGEDWNKIGNWIGDYLLKSESQHFIRCVIPRKNKNTGRSRKETSATELSQKEEKKL